MGTQKNSLNEHPKHMFKLMDKKIITLKFYADNFSLTGPMLVTSLLFYVYRRSCDKTHDLRQELLRKEEIINRLQSDLEHVQLQRVSLEKVQINPLSTVKPVLSSHSKIDKQKSK